MQTRKIVKIDETRCDGCGQCALACAEGAIEIIDGKARLVKDSYCDGLGACLGDCPREAITIEERPAEAFDPAAVHEHLKARAEPPKPTTHEKLPCGCPGSMTRSLEPKSAARTPACDANMEASSELRNWPVQMKLVPANAPYFSGADLLISADCVAHAFADFHRQFLAGRILLVGCPKLDDTELYLRKLTEIFRLNDIRSVEVAFMEVPCCFGLIRTVTQALAASGKTIPLTAVKVSIKGDICERQELSRHA